MIFLLRIQEKNIFGEEGGGAGLWGGGGGA